LGIELPSHVRGRLRRGVVAPWLGAALTVACLVSGPAAQAQSFSWGGTGSTSVTSDYGTATNWSNPAAAPPFLPSQSAIFGGSGSGTVSVGTPFMFADSWTFTSSAQSYSFTGTDLDFNVAGPTGGLINNANAGQIITIGNRINDGFGGAVSVQQLGNSTLVLAGANSYSGGTLISAGTVQVTNANSLGMGTVTLNGGTLQMQSPTLTTVNFSNNFAINAPGGTVDLNGAFVTLSGVISDGAGAGVLSVIDSTGTGSTLELSNANTYSGGTNANGVTLAVTNNSSVGTGAVTLNNAIFQADSPGNLTFANNFRLSGSNTFDANGVTLTIAGNITGAGSLEVANAGGSSGFAPGTVVMLGTNTYTGGTLICSCSTLQLGDPTHTASIIGAVDNEGTFNIVNANTSGITSITNNGEITFSNATSASNAHITNNDEITFSNAASAGNARITNNGGIALLNAASAGSARITNNGGEIFFLDASSAGSANITNRFGGTIFFGTPVPGSTDTSTAGNATIDNNNAGAIFSALTNAGTATITNHNGGGVEFFDSSSAASATIVNNNGGFASFGQPFGTDTPTAGHAMITNNSGGETDFNAFSTAGNAIITTNSGGATFFSDNSTGGNAQFIANGTGFVDFTESVGPNGDGRITAGSIAGSGFYYIGGGNTLIVGSNNLSTSVTGVIADNNPCGCTSGPGSLEKVGTGTLTLSGANTYTGTTTVFGGVLDVEGSIASSVLTTVNAGGSLTGAGTVGKTMIATGGIFLPGNGLPGSSTTVAGNLAFQSGALYLVQLNSVTSTFANVTGTTTLAGTVGASFAAGSAVMKQYMIMTFAGGRSGLFDGAGVIVGGSALVATVSYDPSHAYLNFALNFGAAPGLTLNQQKVGTALSNFFNANGSIPAAFATLTPAGLTQASGELATGTQQATFEAMNLFLGLLTDPFINGRGTGGTGSPGATPFAAEDDSASAYAAKKTDAARDAFAKFPTKAEAVRNDLFDPRWSVWGASYGGGSTTSGNTALGSNNTTARAFGLVAGADYRISPVTLAGFALAGGGTNFGVNGFGTGRSDMFQAGAFVRHTVGSAYVTGALAYAWQDVTTDRTVTNAGIGQLHAQFNANAFSGRVEAGNRYMTPWMGITPYVAGQFTTYSLPAYAEQVLSGAGAFALNYAAKDVTDPRTELGIRTDRSFAMQDGILTLRGRFAWAHDFFTDRNISAVFQALPGASFVVNGAAQAHDSALTTASIEKKWLNGWSAAATFEGEFSAVTNSYAGKGVVRYAW
jgi:autotransporter-associated beta strand protein